MRRRRKHAGEAPVGAGFAEVALHGDHWKHREHFGQARHCRIGLAALLRFDARLLDDLSPFIHLGAEKSGKFTRRGADHHDTARFELAPDRWLREGCDRIGVNFSG